MDIIHTKGPIQDFIRRRHELFGEPQIAEFGACESDFDRFKIVSKTLAKHRETTQSSTVSLVESSVKDLDRALEFKKQGNEFFKKSQWIDALKSYSLSYFHTPQEKSERHSSRSLLRGGTNVPLNPKRIFSQLKPLPFLFS